MRFYAVIIGTEILNARREDKHFSFVQQILAKYNHELFASFIIKDDKNLITNIYKLIQNDSESVMFSFGGIGSTPDDLTREIASEVFTRYPPIRHKKFEQDIINKFGEESYPNRIHMADLPRNSNLLFNPMNNMSGFSLENRFFFVPGFPSMAHPMIEDVIATYFSDTIKKYRLTLLADTSENSLIHIMKKIPPHIELSSLPMFVNLKPAVEISLVGIDKLETTNYFELFTNELILLKIKYKLI